MSAILRASSSALALLAVVLVARPGFAQTPCFDPGSSRQAVSFASPNSDISCVIDFATGQTRSVVAGGQGTNFKGLAVLFKP